MSLWTYPNLYRDQGGGKEVCDLIVVFDNDVILFSDKAAEFRAHDVGVGWQRWRTVAIDKSIDQLEGAKRWISKYPHRIFLDKSCSKQFPLRIDIEKARFHLVCVASGAAVACAAHLHCNGTLGVLGAHTPDDRPFFVPSIRGRKSVLVLDEITMPVVLGELDTIADFVAYLRARDAFIRSDCLAVADSELELLAVHLRSGLDELTRVAGDQRVILTHGLWDSATERIARAQRAELLSSSYAWDTIVESFNQDVLGGRMLPSKDDDGLADHESRLRILARTSRLERKELADAFAILYQIPCAFDEVRFRCVRLAVRPDTIFAFAIVGDAGLSEQEYRRRRREVIRAYCMSIKASHPDVVHVVCVASTRPQARGQSQDIGYLDARDWTTAQQEVALSVQRQCGYYTSPDLEIRGGELVGKSLLATNHSRRLKNAAKRRRRSHR